MGEENRMIKSSLSLISENIKKEKVTERQRNRENGSRERANGEK
jgi:hypothetical protein